MMPEENFTERYATNPFNFEDFELTTLQVICEENFLGGTPIDVGKSHLQTCSTTMRSLGFDHGGNMTNLSKLCNTFNPVFFLTSDLHLGDSSIHPEITGSGLVVELLKI